MNENDTSDEAAFEWISKIKESREGFSMDALRGWQECRRRCEERERKAFEAGWAARSQLGIGSAVRVNQIEEDWREFKERKSQ